MINNEVYRCKCIIKWQAFSNLARHFAKELGFPICLQYKVTIINEQVRHARRVVTRVEYIWSVPDFYYMRMTRGNHIWLALVSTSVIHDIHVWSKIVKTSETHYSTDRELIIIFKTYIYHSLVINMTNLVINMTNWNKPFLNLRFITMTIQV